MEQKETPVRSACGGCPFQAQCPKAALLQKKAERNDTNSLGSEPTALSVSFSSGKGPQHPHKETFQ